MRLLRSVTLFRVFSIPVRVHSTFLIFPLAFGVCGGWWEDSWRGAGVALAALALLYFCGLLHELSHALVGAAVGCRTRAILFIPFGLVAQMEKLMLGWRELAIAAAGPGMSLVLAALAFGLAPARSYRFFEPGPDPVRVALRLAAVYNLMFGCFNLLPCFPLDGGRILRALLGMVVGLLSRWQGHKAYLLATRVAVHAVAWPLAGLLIVWAVMERDLYLGLLAAALIVAGHFEFLLLREFPEEFSLGPSVLQGVNTDSSANPAERQEEEV